LQAIFEVKKSRIKTEKFFLFDVKSVAIKNKTVYDKNSLYKFLNEFSRSKQKKKEMMIVVKNRPNGINNRFSLSEEKPTKDRCQTHPIKAIMIPISSIDLVWLSGIVKITIPRPIIMGIS